MHGFFLWQIFLHQNFGERLSRFDGRILVFLADKVLVSELQSFLDYANDVLFRGMKGA